MRERTDDIASNLFLNFRCWSHTKIQVQTDFAARLSAKFSYYNMKISRSAVCMYVCMYVHPLYLNPLGPIADISAQLT